MSEGAAHTHRYVNVVTQRLDDKRGVVKVAVSGTNTTRVSYAVKSIRFETMPDGERSQEDVGAENRVVTRQTPGELAEQQMTFKASTRANGVEMAITFTDKDRPNYTMTFLLKLDGAHHMTIGATIAQDTSPLGDDRGPSSPTVGDGLAPRASLGLLRPNLAPSLGWDRGFTINKSVASAQGGCEAPLWVTLQCCGDNECSDIACCGSTNDTFVCTGSACMIICAHDCIHCGIPPVVPSCNP
jgi:hypothetical protein